jgi:hypothetical protein
MFWSTDEGLYNVDQLTKNAQDHIITALKRNMPKEDLELLHDAFKHMYVYFDDGVCELINHMYVQKTCC